MSDLDRLEELQSQLERASGAEALRSVIRDTLAVPAPKGDPGYLGDLAASYKSAAADLGTTHDDVQRVGYKELPEAWEGMASDRAGGAVKSVSHAINDASYVLDRVSREFEDLAEELGKARQRDGHGRAPLPLP